MKELIAQANGVEQVKHDSVVVQEGVHSQIQEVQVGVHEQSCQELVVVFAMLQTIDVTNEGKSLLKIAELIR